MRPSVFTYSSLIAGLVTLSVAQAALSNVAPAPAPAVPGISTAEGVAFFETKIRPVLAARCYACHAEKKSFGGLRLDTGAAIRKGGDAGPIFVAGKPKESRLIKALNHDGLKMPPTGKLPAPVIADFQRWVVMGAPLPAGAAESGGAAIDVAAGRKHWAF